MKQIYVKLRGRIGNQLFVYAFARQLQREYGEEAMIVIDDTEVLKVDWEDSLPYYDIKNIRFVHDEPIEKSIFSIKQRAVKGFFSTEAVGKNFMDKYTVEKKWQPRLNQNGIISCENGFIDYKLNTRKNVFIEGYFQSEKYFKDAYEDIRYELRPEQFKEIDTYPNIDKIRERNTVCISIKVEHNVGNELYEVCDMKYWEKAIAYITEQVENPLFFICSDNVDYVVNNLIDTDHFDYVVQSKEYPVHVSLAVMNQCKHFIIGNTTFGWWAQYLADAPDKIVVAPSKWMLVDMPIDIYQEGWHLIEV